MSPRSERPDGPGAADESPDSDAAALVPGGFVRLRVVAAILVVEAVALVVFVGYLVVNLIAGTEETTATSNTVIEAALFAGVAVVLVLLARGALAARRWSRAPVLVTQLIALLGPGLTILQGDLWYRFVLGVPVFGAAAAAILLTLTPSVTAAMDAVDTDR